MTKDEELQALREENRILKRLVAELLPLKEHLAQANVRGRLHDSLTKLSREDRILVTLWYWKELPVAEIAVIMGKTEAAIRKRLSRAQQRLKELMHESLDP